jgi:hypothetical protein
MSVERLVNLMTEFLVSEERKNKPCGLGNFTFERTARQLVGPATERAVHHRKREDHYTVELEKAERELREKGVTVEVYDQGTGTSLSYSNSICSGNVTGMQQNFQPKIDQRLLDLVKNAKNKMLEHRSNAERYEKFSRAFACAPDTKVTLTVEDAHFFRLEK